MNETKKSTFNQGNFEALAARGGLMIHWKKKSTSEFNLNFNENDIRLDY